MIKKTSFLLILLLIVVSSKAICQFSFDNYALHEVNLIDVNNLQVIENQTIVVSKDRIIGIYDSDQYAELDTVQLLRFEGYFLTPGLIDSHVHMATDATSEIRANAEKVLKEMLKTGIMSVRDMAGDARALASLSRDALVDDIVAPNIYYSALMAGPEFFTDPRTLATAQGGKSGAMSYMKSIDHQSDLVQEIAQAKGT